MRILVVEDDCVLAAALTRALNQSAYAVDLVADGEAANDALATTAYDLVVLDIALPKVDGLAVLRRLRDRRLQTPVLILTARDTLDDRVLGLDSGADDYLTKPFDLPEFEARVRALIRRGHSAPGASLTHGRVRLDVAPAPGALHGPAEGRRARLAFAEELVRLRQGAPAAGERRVRNSDVRAGVSGHRGGVHLEADEPRGIPGALRPLPR
jgi:two-component system OmpR family response regulator